MHIEWPILSDAWARSGSVVRPINSPGRLLSAQALPSGQARAPVFNGPYRLNFTSPRFQFACPVSFSLARDNFLRLNTSSELPNCRRLSGTDCAVHWWRGIRAAREARDEMERMFQGDVLGVDGVEVFGSDWEG